MNMANWKIKFPPKPGLIAGLLFLLIACVHPLFLTPRGYTRITDDKYIFLLGAVGFCTALWLLWAIVTLGKGNRLDLATESRPLAFRVADIALPAFLVAAVISTLLSGNSERSLIGDYQRNDGLLTQLAYGLIYFILSRSFRPRRRHGVWMVAVAGLIWLYAVLQAFDLDPLHLFDFEGYIPASGIPYTTYTMTFRSTLGNINLLSTWAVVITAVMGLLYLADPWRWRKLWLLGSFFGFHTLLMAASDSGMVGLAGTIFFLLPWLLKTKVRSLRLCHLAFVRSCAALFYALHFQRNAAIAIIALVVTGVAALVMARLPYPSPKVMGRLGWILMLVIVLTALAALLWLDTGESGTLYEAGQMLRGNFNDRFGSSRIFIWKRALQAATAHPWFGTGPDSFFRAFKPWQSEAYRVTGIRYDKAHNEYLQILVCQGGVGLLCWLTFLGACLVGGFRKAVRNPMMMAMVGGIVAYAIQAFFNFSTPIATPIFWILLGVMTAPSAIAEDTVSPL